MSAKKRHHKASGKAKSNPLARPRRRNRAKRNPLIAGQTTGKIVTMVGASAAGLIGDVYIPAWLLGLMNQPDSGMWSYILAALTVIVPTYIFSKINWDDVAKGWLAGAGAGFIWRAIDDATGQKFVTVTTGSGVGAFSTQQQITLPGPNVFSQFNRKALPAGPSMGSVSSASAVSAPVGRGMGYVRYPYAA